MSTKTDAVTKAIVELKQLRDGDNDEQWGMRDEDYHHTGESKLNDVIKSLENFSVQPSADVLKHLNYLDSFKRADFSDALSYTDFEERMKLLRNALKERAKEDEGDNPTRARRVGYSRAVSQPDSAKVLKEKIEARISELEGQRIHYVAKSYHKVEPSPENLEAIKQVGIINARIGELRQIQKFINEEEPKT